MRRAHCGSRHGVDPMPSQRKDGKPRKTNRYPTTCRVCGVRCEPGEAALEWTPETGCWYALCVWTERFLARGNPIDRKTVDTADLVRNYR